jgi:hypothetical protein
MASEVPPLIQRAQPAEICVMPYQKLTADNKPRKIRKIMKLFKAATTIYCLTLMAAAIAPNLRADEWNKKAVVTFSEPVETPGVHLAGWAVLPAGSYVFKLLDSQSDRHIVQIMNKEETTVYATVLCIPDSRLRATDKTVITFDERPADQPVALRAWFSPGSTSGDEFVYPKEKAMQLAKSNRMPVPFIEVAIPFEVAETSQSSSAPVVVAMRTAPVMTAQPSAEPSAPVATPATLPATASNAPLIGLLGLFALSGALLLGGATKPVR